MNTSRNRSIIILILLLLGGFLLFGMFNKSQSTPKESTISEVATLVNDGKVKTIHIDNDQVIADLTDGQQLKAYKEAGVGLNDYGIISTKVSIDVKNPSRGALLSSILSILLPFLLVAIFLWFILKQAQAGNMRAMSFGKTQARVFTGKKNVTFDDVAGSKEAKQELIEVVDFLKHPAKYKAIGAEIPRGVLLVGAPGVGKTLLAKAVAGEAGVPFFSLSASEFVEMFVGVGAARVRDLFGKAKQNAPALIFIDELDAIGRQRGTGMGGGHDEREQTLNQILVEMDGFETDSRVIIMAATNRPDVLDPALLRPGRFDRRVVLDLPDRGEREEILKLHIQGRSVAKNIRLDQIAGATPGASGADLKNIVNEASILAARDDRKEVTQQDFDKSIEKVVIGPERKSRLMNQQEKEIAGYHEVGHALVGHFLVNNDPIHKISLVSRGSALGYTWSLPEEDSRLVTKSKFEDEIAQLLGGREAEKLIFNETTTGAENDLKKATRIARDMVKIYGMSEKLGPIQFGQRDDMMYLGGGSEQRNYSESIAAQLDEEIKRIVLKAEDVAKSVLKKHKSLLESITKQLLKNETIEREEFEKLVSGVAA